MKKKEALCFYVLTLCEDLCIAAHRLCNKFSIRKVDKRGKFVSRFINWTKSWWNGFRLIPWETRHSLWLQRVVLQ